MDGLLICIDGRWTPSFVDHTAVELAVLALYVAASALATRAAFAAAAERVWRRRLTLFWAATALVFALLAINKPVDLQSLLIASGRCLSDAQGWSDWRWEVKRTFVALAGLGMAGVLLFSFWLLRPVIARLGAALLGLTLTVLYIVFLAAWHSDIHIPLGTQLGMRGLLWLAEFPGPVLVALGALAFVIRPFRRTAP